MHYAEGVYVGYRYYEAKKMPVRWAFGHGLSYTEFAYSNVRISAENFGDEDEIGVSVDVTNVGSMAGKEVVQLYVKDCTGTFGRPVKELKGFAKVALEPGETKTVTLTLDARSLSYYDVDLGDWYAPSGKYELLLGHASDDIRLTAEVTFQTRKVLPLEITAATTIGELLGNPVTAQIIGQMMQKATQDERRDISSATQSESDTKMMQSMMMGMPLKSLVSYSVMTVDQLQGLMQMLKAALGQR